MCSKLVTLARLTDGIRPVYRITRVLVLVKASPQPSRQYGDTVCVAGVELDGATPRWVRLYPVPFRYLEGESQFKKYDIINVETRDAGADKRPESRKINASSIRVERQVKGWANRDAWLSQLEYPSMCHLLSMIRRNIDSQSLAAVSPASVIGLEFSPHPGWSASELQRFEQYRSQGDLFRESPPRLLDPPQFIVHLRYRCAMSECDGHAQRIIDWELTALQQRYRSRGEVQLKQVILRNFFRIPFGADRTPLIFVGNQENIQRRGAFTILGLYYPRKADLVQRERLF
jgi:hypothetical protein